MVTLPSLDLISSGFALFPHWSFSGELTFSFSLFRLVFLFLVL